jgi:hypothetical protein
MIMLSIGRQGSGQPLWDRLEKEYSRAFSFLNFGEQTREKISEFLNSVDFGIATTPYSIIGKSATAAAMIEHGLPVIVNRDDLRFKGVAAAEIDQSPLFLRLSSQLFENLGEIQRKPPRSLLPEIAERFLTKISRSFAPASASHAN